LGKRARKIKTPAESVRKLPLEEQAIQQTSEQASKQAIKVVRTKAFWPIPSSKHNPANKEN